MTQTLQIIRNGQDVSGKGIRDSTKLLQQYIPDLTASLIGSVIVLGQGLPQKFTNNTPSGRKEVLEKLSKSDFMIEDLKERLSRRKTELTRDLRSYEDNLISLDSKKSFLQSEVKQQLELLDSLDKAELENRRTILTKKLTELEKAIDVQNNNIETLSFSKEDLLAKRTSVVNDETTELYELDRTFQIKTQPLKEQKSKITAELTVAKNQLTSMRNIKDVCPTCGQKLPDVHKPDTSEIENLIHSYQNILNQVFNDLSTFETDYDERRVAIQKSYFEKKSSIDKAYTEACSTYDSEKAARTSNERELKVLKADLSTIEIQVAQLQTTIDNCNKIIRDNNEELKVIDDDILYNNMQRDLTQSHIEVVNKFDTVLKRDFRGYLLSTVINYIENKAKDYCDLIFNTTDLTFCLDGNNIDIRYCDKAYENLSGGERQKIDLIIQFSIRDMLSSQLNFTSNILVLDEIFDGLDTSGCNRVVDMISNLSDVRNVFIVTHRKDLSIPSDKELIVVKSSAGISEMRY